jgi:hypothetical protein
VSQSGEAEGGSALPGPAGRGGAAADLSAYGFDDLPRSTVDDTDLGWDDDRGSKDERERTDDARLAAERPPHWS